MKRDCATQSIWQVNTSDYGSLYSETIRQQVYDVVIVGGGITGVTTALLLQQAGKSCLLVEAETLAYGATGGTTAHINTIFDTPYHTVIKNFGEENARLLAQAGKASIDLIKYLIEKYKIDCDFSELKAYFFSLNEKQDKELDEMVETTRKLGLPMDYADSSPFPFPYIKIASIEAQAQFNPVRYIFQLAKAFEELGGQIAQHCRVTHIKDGDVLEIQSTRGVIQARHAIYATHIPPGINLLHFRCAPYRSYALAVRLKDNNYPDALGYDMHNPYHYYRTQKVDDKKYLIVGGEDHKTGHEENTEACLRRLESCVRTYFEVEEVCNRWSSQYYEPADGLPYIGNLPGSSKNIWVATGYSGNGMTYGTMAALILSNILVNGHSIYQELFNPKRIKPVAGFNHFIKEGIDVVKNLVFGKLAVERLNEIADMAPGEGKFIKHEGRVMGLYKDENHELYAVNCTCPHFKCTIHWNMVEKSWDCPCHGSRFSYDGKLLTPPAGKDLQKIYIKADYITTTERKA